MKVCLLNDSFPPVIDGVANVVMNYGRIMQEELGAEVLVGTPRYPGVDYDHYPYKVIAYPSLDTTGLISGYRTGNPLAMKEIDEMAHFWPEIIHSHCPAASTVMARVLRNQTGAPIVFTYHTKFDVDITRAVGDGFLQHRTIDAMVDNISACDDVWVVSRGAGENLCSLGYEGDFIVMNNGVDFPRGRSSADAVKAATKDFDLPEGVPVFLFVGRMMKYKGLPLIIDAMKYLSEGGFDFRMVFIGGGADAEEMHTKVRDLGLTLDLQGEDGKVSSLPGAAASKGRVIFTGPIRDREKLRAWNTRADLFLFPSVYDTNGIVVREAAACGLASVLINGSCAAEGITHTHNGYLIEETAESMAMLLMDACGNMECVHQVGQNAMDEIYISWEQATRAAYERYGELGELLRNGTLEKRRKERGEKASDHLLDGAATAADKVREFFDASRNFYEGMIGNVEDFGTELKEELKEGLEELRERIPEGVKEFGEKAKRLGENAQKGVKAGLEYAEKSMREGFGMSDHANE
ncbi:MAG: glycosyltransferase [Lachnospiraceae bacterium]|nr:glycosyltransferase [Lachnospiraceae bacterium]